MHERVPWNFVYHLLGLLLSPILSKQLRALIDDEYKSGIKHVQGKIRKVKNTNSPLYKYIYINIHEITKCRKHYLLMIKMFSFA